MIWFENRSLRGVLESNRINGKNTRAVKAFRQTITAGRSHREQGLWCSATHADVLEFQHAGISLFGDKWHEIG
jgi:hypothetical protein